ncbi:MAG: aldolase [Epsilonproteobacteria bacterium]|nr:aldolase [Campylobacterota bacterium]
MANYLMVSGHQQKHLNKISEIDVEVVMLNLEDGVPKEKKKEALLNIKAFLQNAPKNKRYVVRVNPLKEGGVDEIKELEEFDFEAFRIPKVTTPLEIELVKKFTKKDIHLSVETKESFFELSKFQEIKAAYIGIYDLLNDLKLPHSIIALENPLIHKILADFSLQARYLNITPVGFVYQYYKDLEGFGKWCLLQKNLGMQGVGCITPAQVEIANKIFKEDFEFAKMIVERFESDGPFTIDGLYVDEPIYKNYKQILKD